MYESPADLAALQDLLDRSATGAGAHLRSVLTPERRLSAAELWARLVGMSLLALATATADGRPLIGPVDGIFYRGASAFLHFHEDPAGLFADLRSGDDFARYGVNTRGEIDRLLRAARTRASGPDGAPRRSPHR